jgi:glycosyltransferase involved in cell wall biosynthesis
VDDPLVTIVTPSFNQGRFIRATIESVLHQDYPHIEYIVMDGGSTDDTAAVVAAYADRLHWISEKDRGQSHAINKGFRMARGEVVAWINSDDVLYAGAVSRAVAALRQSPRLGAVYGEGDLMDEHGRVTGRFPATEPFNLWKLIHVWDYILQQSVYFRRSVVEEVGYLDESLNWALDWDLLIRIGVRYDLGYIPHAMGALREYGAAKTFSGGHRRFRELVGVLRHHGHHRFPPGYFLYGLDTYQGVASRALDRLLPRALSARLQSQLNGVVAARMARVLREAQGIYAGGWATGRVEWMVPACHRRVRVCGTVPEIQPGLDDQWLQVQVDGRTIGGGALGLGDFAIEVELPVAGAVAGPPLLVLHAARTIPAESVGLLPAQRPVAYVLREIAGLS